jgi:ADP-heptose:LPS heptosyltransferase
MWKPLFDSVDAHFVSLQYKDASQEIEGTQVVQYPWATLTKDYDDTAALVAACNLVVTVPTSVAHLSAALGTPTVVMQSSKPCWKFAGGLAFHPGVKLIDNNGDWAKTMSDTVKYVRQWVEK